jgi:hypothetical protein
MLLAPNAVFTAFQLGRIVKWGLMIDCWHAIAIATLVYFLLGFRIGRILKFKRESLSKFAMSAFTLIF